jgi:hypothetical protein
MAILTYIIIAAKAKFVSFKLLPERIKMFCVIYLEGIQPRKLKL